MSVFRVWAPQAARVELVAGDDRRPLARDPEGEGWWCLDAPDLGPGTEYGFSLDGGPARPDPRSRWQPYGVHGPSRVVAPPDSAGHQAGHQAGGWAGWQAGGQAGGQAGWWGFHLPSAVLYEVHVGTFTPQGTFDGAIERLDHLVDLGVTGVSLMPVNAFPGRHGWGYDGVGLFAVHDAYGGPEGLRRFVSACHERGLGVVLDVVYNHLGPSGNYLSEFGPYFTDRYATPWGQAPNLDGGESDEVRRFFLDNALAWLGDYGIDGLRLDAVHAIVDTSAVHILEELAGEVEALAAALGRPLWLIAESDLNDPRLLWSRERGGYGLHAQWSDDFHHALHAVLTGERAGYYADFGRLEDVARALRHAYVYAGRRSSFRRRRHGRPADGLSGHRFLGYIQNHDQVGNRARGERIGHLVGAELQKVAAALVLTAPFVPMIFQGEEWGASAPFQYFTDHGDPALARAVREGRRDEFAAFGWDPSDVPDPQDPATFLRSRLDWDERTREPHRDVEAWYRALISFRRTHTALLDGDLDGAEITIDEDARTLRLRRGGVTTVCNLSQDPRSVPLDRHADGHADGHELVLASREGVVLRDAAVALPGHSAALLVSRNGRR